MTTDETSTTETVTETETEKKTEEVKPETGKANDIAAMEAALKKANKEAEKQRLRVQELENATLSETEKATKAKADAERERDEARMELLRLKVGNKHNLPADIAERLRGTTEEELTEDAKRLKELLKPGTPKGDAEGGTRGKTPDSKNDINRLLRAAAGHG